MNLLEIVRRPQPPEPWAEGEKIPWNDPEFSKRMLREHLSQAHDHASRRLGIIDAHVGWIHSALLGGRPSRVLDLACGPGLYLERLGSLGHRCTGVDFSPASIAYARERAASLGLPCQYIKADIRDIDTLNLEPVDLVMLVYGEANVFRREHIRAVLQGARRLLSPGGLLVLEPHTFEAVKALGEQPATWYSAESGLFSERPHIVLHECHWDVHAAVATERFLVIDAATAAVTRHALSAQAYTDQEYASLVESAGYRMLHRHAGLAGDRGPVDPSLFALVAEAR